MKDVRLKKRCHVYAEWVEIQLVVRQSPIFWVAASASQIKTGGHFIETADCVLHERGFRFIRRRRKRR